MGAAQRHREFVAGLASERPRLHVPKMVRVRWLAAANEAWLLSHVTQMLPVAVPPRCRNREDTLVDAAGLIVPFGRENLRAVLPHHLYRCGTLARGSVAYSAR
jgi:hypothetical protein